MIESLLWSLPTGPEVYEGTTTYGFYSISFLFWLVPVLVRILPLVPYVGLIFKALSTGYTMINRRTWFMIDWSLLTIGFVFASFAAFGSSYLNWVWIPFIYPFLVFMIQSGGEIILTILKQIIPI